MTDLYIYEKKKRQRKKFSHLEILSRYEMIWGKSEYCIKQNVDRFLKKEKILPLFFR